MNRIKEADEQSMFQEKDIKYTGRERISMKGLGKRIAAGILTATICVTNAGITFAAEEEKKEDGILSAVGGWFSERGEDLQNAGTCAGIWFLERTSDVQHAATSAADATGQWFADRGEDILCTSAAVYGWTYDRYNDAHYFVTSTGEWIVYTASNADFTKLATTEYYLDSSEKLFLGDYSDKDPTALSIGLNLAASAANLDLGMDIRDLVYDVQNFGSDEVKLSGLALDAVAVLPVIGVVKNLKYVDTVADSVKMVSDITETASEITEGIDTAVDLADGVHDAVKAADTADIAADTAKASGCTDDAVKSVSNAEEAAKAADVIDDALDAGKVVSGIALVELPEKAQETFKIYSDCGWDGRKALDYMTEGTNAGRPFYNKGSILPVFDPLGNKLSYTEYDAFSFGKDPLFPKGRGLSRFVRDNLGNVYFTEDHYDSYSLVIEALVG